MHKLFALFIIIFALLLNVPKASAAPFTPIYATRNDGFLKYTWYWDPYARSWVLIRVEIYFPDWNDR